MDISAKPFRDSAVIASFLLSSSINLFPVGIIIKYHLIQYNALCKKIFAVRKIMFSLNVFPMTAKNILDSQYGLI